MSIAMSPAGYGRASLYKEFRKVGAVFCPNGRFVNRNAQQPPDCIGLSPSTYQLSMIIHILYRFPI
jgi:hypothetical protein